MLIEITIPHWTYPKDPVKSFTFTFIFCVKEGSFSQMYEIQTLNDVTQAKKQILCLYCFHVMILISNKQNVVGVEGNMVFLHAHLKGLLDLEIAKT